MNWKKVNKIIQQNQRFAITAHINPEGDALGAGFALYHFLKANQKEVHLIVNDPLLPMYNFLDSDGLAEVFDENKHTQLLSEVDVILIVDVNCWDYMGQVGTVVEKSPAFKICFDHHVIEGKFADLDLIETSACAAGELVYDFLKAIKHKITPEIATAIYASILTDTGVFRFPNTTAKAHLISAELLSIGIDHNRIYEALFEDYSWAKIKLLDLCLANIQSEAEGKLAWILVTDEMLKEAGANWDDADGFIDVVRTISGVIISVIFRECEENKIKLHFRSKGNIDVQQLAVQFGGGGHRVSSGATVTGSTEEVIPQVLSQAQKLI